MPNATARATSPLHADKDRRAAISDTDRNEIEQLYTALRHDKAKLVGLNGESRPLPDSVHAFLVELVGLLDKGKSVTIVRNQTTLTTVEAASLLGVSRQFLVNLLEKGAIPYHLVGTHRRIYSQDVFLYKAQRDVHRHQVIRELAQAEAREGLYDRESTSVDES